MYFSLGKLYFRHQASPVRDEAEDYFSLTDDAASSSSGSGKNEAFEEAWWLMWTAVEVGGQKQARAYLALMLENGLLPSEEVFKEYTDEGKKYEYLQYITDLKQFVKTDTYSLAEFK